MKIELESLVEFGVQVLLKLRVFEERLESR